MLDTRVCPHCGGEIKTAARLCKHCKREVPPAVEVVSEQLPPGVDVVSAQPLAALSPARPVAGPDPIDVRLVLGRSRVQKGKSMIFRVTCRVEMSDAATSLLATFRAGDRSLLSDGGRLSARDLIGGLTYEFADAGEVMLYEKQVKDACGLLKALLSVMAKFGDTHREESIDIVYDEE
jgi:hypothetical protein